MFLDHHAYEAAERAYLRRLSSDVVHCPVCRHAIQRHGTTRARDRAWCSAYRRDGTQCDCTRIPTEDELIRIMFEPYFEEPLP
jgi:hypothetical protein